jgi:hypothetical protein
MPTLADSSLAGARERHVDFMTKNEARDEVLRRWHALPAEDRHTYQHAQVFAAAFAEDLDFRTMGNARKVIAAWLVQDLEATPPDDSPADAKIVNGALTGSAEAGPTS